MKCLANKSITLLVLTTLLMTSLLTLSGCKDAFHSREESVSSSDNNNNPGNGTNTGSGSNAGNGTNTGNDNGTNAGDGSNPGNGTNAGGGSNPGNGTNTGGGSNTGNGNNNGGGNTGSGSNPSPVNVPGDSFADKLAWLRAHAETGGDYTIEISGTETDSGEFAYNGNNITIRLKGSGSFSTITANFTIQSGVTLVIENVTLLKSSIRVSGGNLIMNSGSTNTSTPSGKITVSSKGTFTMNGGIISGNQSAAGDLSPGGVSVSNGTFTMNGGTISGNRILGMGGGVYVGANGNFIMNDGTISDNIIALGNLGYSGGGVYVGTNGTFTMTGGTISGNTSPSTFGNGGSGGGVHVAANGIFTMEGGLISGNIARARGGGVDISSGGYFIKTGGTITGYGSDQGNGNVVKNISGTVQNYMGHAVYAGSDNTIKYKDTTAGPSSNISWTNGTSSGGWDN